MSDIESQGQEIEETTEVVDVDTGVEDVDTGDVAPEGEQVEPVYTPNFTYRVKDAEYEIPEHLRSYIKDAESEAMFRDLVERAHGLEEVKADRSELRGQNQELSQQVQSWQTWHQKAEQFKQAGDWDSYFEYMGVPPQVLMQQTKKLLQVYDPNDPTKSQAYQQQRQQFWDYQQQQDYAQQLQTTLATQREREMDLVINYRQDVQEVAQEFDQRMGRVGAFREEVIRRGQLAWQTQKRDLSADEAVNEVLSLLGKQPMNGQQNGFNSQPQAAFPVPGQGQPYQGVPPQQPRVGGYTQAAGQRPAVVPTTQTAGQARPPVIPNIDGSGSGGAPVRRPTVKSFEDIKKRQQEIRQGIGR